MTFLEFLRFPTFFEFMHDLHFFQDFLGFDSFCDVQRSLKGLFENFCANISSVFKDFLWDLADFMKTFRFQDCCEIYNFLKTF